MYTKSSNPTKYNGAYFTVYAQKCTVNHPEKHPK